MNTLYNNIFNKLKILKSQDIYLWNSHIKQMILVIEFKYSKLHNNISNKLHNFILILYKKKLI